MDCLGGRVYFKKVLLVHFSINHPIIITPTNSNHMKSVCHSMANANPNKLEANHSYRNRESCIKWILYRF